MNQIKIALAAAVFAVLAACGGGSSIQDACEHVCDCRGTNTDACVSSCKEEAEEDSPSDECVDCIADAACDEFSDCLEVCGDDD